MYGSVRLKATLELGFCHAIAVIIPCTVNPKYTNLILGIRVRIRVGPNSKSNPNPNPNLKD